MLKMKALFVSHDQEAYAELSQGQALDLLFGVDSAEIYGDHVTQIVDLGYAKLELHRNNEYREFAGYDERVKELSKCYINISDEFEEVG